MEAKICYITAIYNNETLNSCPKYVKQTIATDFICFTDNPNINSNGWLIDTFPYHKCIEKEIDIINFYKQQYKTKIIPFLKKYDVIIWLDETYELNYDKAAICLLNGYNRWKK